MYQHAPPCTDAVPTLLNPRKHPLASRPHCDPLRSLLCCSPSLICLQISTWRVQSACAKLVQTTCARNSTPLELQLHPCTPTVGPNGHDDACNTAYLDGELLPQGRGPPAPATTWARHAAAAAAGAAARVAIGPPRAQALCEACALAARTLWQAAVWLLNLLKTKVQLSGSRP